MGAERDSETNDEPTVPMDVEVPVPTKTRKQKVATEEDILRSQTNEEIKKKQVQMAKHRLRYLVGQTELFGHFLQDQFDEANEKLHGVVRRHRLQSLSADDDLFLTETEEEETHRSVRLTVQPACIVGGEMRNYQLEGLNWLIRLQETGINGILADEMGLGKTLQTISLLGYLKQYRNIGGPHLVVAPKSTLPAWRKEFLRWCPSLKTLVLIGSKEQRQEIVANQMLAGQFEVLITSYEIAIRERAHLRKFAFRYLVVDEAHRIKNEQSLLSQVLRLYTSQHRLLITGTPLQNNLHELWALLNFLLPDVFASSTQFDSWFNLGDDNADSQKEVIDQLHKILRPFLLRRVKSEVENLPPKKEVLVMCGMSEIQKGLYRKILSKDLDAFSPSGDRVRLLNIVMQLRKCCNHPYLFEGQEPGPPYQEGAHLWDNAGKMAVLHKLLIRLKDRGSRVLIFSQMTAVLDILDDYCRFQGWAYCRIDGSTDGEDRESYIEEYNKDGSDKFIFLLSTRAGGLGINLATADTVVLYDSDWNPQVDLQAQDRCHRIGQRKPVNVYRMVTEGTIEEKIVERAEMKLHLDALVIQQGRLVDKNKRLGKDELVKIIRFGADEIFKSSASTMSEEDIELILQRGEIKTKELTSRLKKHVKPGLLETLKLDDARINSYEFEGVDYRKDIKEDQAELVKMASTYVAEQEPRKRERKVGSYCTDEYYRGIMKKIQENQKKRKQKRAARVKTAPLRYSFQFFPRRLLELEAREEEHRRLVAGIAEPPPQLQLIETVARAQERGETGETGAGAGAGAPPPRRPDTPLSELGIASTTAPSAGTPPAALASSAALSVLAAGETRLAAGDGAVAGAAAADAAAAAAGAEGSSVEAALVRGAMLSPPLPSPGPEMREEEEAENGEAPAGATVALVPYEAEMKTERKAEEEEEEQDVKKKAKKKAKKPKKAKRPDPRPLTEEEQQEKAVLEEAGFGDWNRRVFSAFLRGVEKYGPTRYHDISIEVGLSAEEVRRYSEVFWRRYKELEDWEKIINNLQKATERRQQDLRLARAISALVKQTPNPEYKLVIPYSGKQTHRRYTNEEDQWLVVATEKVGYGNWEALMNQVRVSESMRFDWFLKSRTCFELMKRVQTLARMIEKGLYGPGAGSKRPPRAPKTSPVPAKRGKKSKQPKQLETSFDSDGTGSPVIQPDSPPPMF